MILGVAYKKNVSDCRESPALDVMRILSDKGAILVLQRPVRSIASNGRDRAEV